MTPSTTLVRLLHLEDNPRAAQIIREQIEANGLACEISHVTSQAQFERAVAKRSFDLVLCDYNIPCYDPFTAMDEVHRTQPDVPVIFISGAMGDDPTGKCLQEGAADYVLKYRLERLVPSMQRALRNAAGQRTRREAMDAARKRVSLPRREPCLMAA